MKFFIDTEFIEAGPTKPIQLISIGMVAEDGRTLYAISNEFNGADANDWVKENVIAKLETEKEVPRKSLGEIAFQILAFVWTPENQTKPQFWGYYADYDWVVFCQIFGAMIHLPKGFPMYCRDLKQWCDQLGNPVLPKQQTTEHKALNDALWNKKAWEFLNDLKNK